MVKKMIIRELATSRDHGSIRPVPEPIDSDLTLDEDDVKAIETFRKERGKTYFT